jgi:hypothetical protein
MHLEQQIFVWQEPFSHIPLLGLFGVIPVAIIIIIIIIIIISYSLFTDFPDTFPLEPVVNPTTQVSSF